MIIDRVWFETFLMSFTDNDMYHWVFEQNPFLEDDRLQIALKKVIVEYAEEYTEEYAAPYPRSHWTELYPVIQSPTLIRSHGCLYHELGIMVRYRSPLRRVNNARVIAKRLNHIAFHLARHDIWLITLPDGMPSDRPLTVKCTVRP